MSWKKTLSKCHEANVTSKSRYNVLQVYVFVYAAFLKQHRKLYLTQDPLNSKWLGLQSLQPHTTQTTCYAIQATPPHYIGPQCAPQATHTTWAPNALHGPTGRHATLHRTSTWADMMHHPLHPQPGDSRYAGVPQSPSNPLATGCPSSVEHVTLPDPLGTG